MIVEEKVHIVGRLYWCDLETQSLSLKGKVVLLRHDQLGEAKVKQIFTHIEILFHLKNFIQLGRSLFSE